MLSRYGGKVKFLCEGAHIISPEFEHNNKGTYQHNNKGTYQHWQYTLLYIALNNIEGYEKPMPRRKKSLTKQLNSRQMRRLELIWKFAMDRRKQY